MKLLTRDKTTLVVFWTKWERKDFGSTRYSKTKKATEFPVDTLPEKAIESIYEEHGRVTDRTTAGRPTLAHAIISCHSVIKPHERAQIEAWKATEEPLFSGQAWQQCISCKRGAEPY